MFRRRSERAISSRILGQFLFFKDPIVYEYNSYLSLKFGKDLKRTSYRNTTIYRERND